MKVKILLKKEFISLFYTPLGFIFIVVFLLVANFLFFNSFWLANHASLRSYFNYLSLLLVFLIPALTMRSFAEEKRLGTEEIMFTLPLNDGQIVAGKFLANLAFLAVLLVLTLTVPLSVAGLGNLDWGATFSGYLGVLLLGSFYLSLGLYVSSLTGQQISAFLASFFISFVLFLSGQSFVLDKTPAIFMPLVQFISPAYHFNNLSKGVIDIRDILYYFSFTAFFLFILFKKLTLRRYQ